MKKLLFLSLTLLLLISCKSTPENAEIRSPVLFEENGRLFFLVPMEEHELDVVLSIDNYPAAFAAVARFPALAVPMGISPSGEPKSLTLIAKPFQEDKLLQLGHAFEEATQSRKAPEKYN